MKDLVLLAVSFYLLKQDLMRVALSGKQLQGGWTTGNESSDGLAAGRIRGTVGTALLFKDGSHQ
jgi:hypothetical protein